MLPDRLKDRLDPAYAAWLVATNPPTPPDHRPTIAEMRAGFAAQVAISNGPLADEVTAEDASVRGRDGHEVALRIYRHRDADAAAPWLCFLHGGGWVLGDLDTHQGLCNDLVVRTRRTVVAIDYRLAPEHPFPTAVHDCVDALRALVERAAAFALEASAPAVFADSAGANLAVAAALELAGTSAAPRALALVYPALGADMDRPSFAENADVPGLTPELMTFFFVSYIGGDDALPDPLVAPLTVADLSGLPPTLISVAEFDPLRDDGRDFAARLDGAGVEATLRCEPGLGHGYLWVRRRSPAAAAAFVALADFATAAR